MKHGSPMRRVVKVGGSLLNLPDVCERVQEWLARQPRAVNLLVVGGGALADDIAARQRDEGFDDATAHWLCIWAMQENAKRLASLACERSGAVVFDVETFLREIEARSASPLPESWDVSSDSIAARIATTLNAGELVLLKSTLPADRGALGDYVDAYFTIAARGLRAVRFVNLRSFEFDELRYQS